ncbi:4-coumarate-CoA ligase [Colletotrichum tofieldiae]|nr:4-coumarate-CoA ligase [Colletotrichum tofieldiae]
MPINSRWSEPIPNCSLQTWIFGSSFDPLSDRKAFYDADRPDTHYLTFSDYRFVAKQIAIGLQAAGLKPGDRVLLFSGNNLFFPVIFLGVLMAGGIFTGANPGFVTRELAYQLTDSGATFMVAAEGSLDIALEAAKEVSMPASNVFTYFVANFAKQGIPVYIMSGFDFVKMLTYIQRYRVTQLVSVPPILVALTKHPITAKFDLSSLESIGSGAAPLAADVARQTERILKKDNLIVRQGWGMTEVTCTAMTWDPTRLERSSSVGELMPNYQGKLVGEDGKEITEAKVPGELWVTGPTVMRGYWRNPKATEETIVTDADGNRWLRTGDVAYVADYSEGGLFFIVDRMKELIKVKGNQVAPAELEALLLERQDVADAAVIGVTINGEEFPGPTLSGRLGPTPRARRLPNGWRSGFPSISASGVVLRLQMSSPKTL